MLNNKHMLQLLWAWSSTRICLQQAAYMSVVGTILLIENLKGLAEVQKLFFSVESSHILFCTLYNLYTFYIAYSSDMVIKSNDAQHSRNSDVLMVCSSAP